MSSCTIEYPLNLFSSSNLATARLPMGYFLVVQSFSNFTSHVLSTKHFKNFEVSLYFVRCRQPLLIWYSDIYRHDDVIKWKHVPPNWPFVWGIHRSPVNSPHKGQWRGALMFSLICVWINDWVINREAGDLRRYRAHYDVIVMALCYPGSYAHTHTYIIYCMSVTWGVNTRSPTLYHETNLSKIWSAAI